MKKKLKNIKGILSDIDGTLYFKGSPIPGTIETVSILRRKGIKLLFFTNTDSKTPKSIYKNLLEYGFNLNEDELFTPIIALKKFLSVHRQKKIFLISTKEIENEFNEFNLVKGDEIPDYVIIADFRDNWDVFRLNRAFKYILKGAKLLGTQGNRYFLDHKGEPVIDTGSFVKMLADAANVPYKIFGKPSKVFFKQALNKLNLISSDCIVIGDDFESDIQGANNVGIKSILVRTGKGIHYAPSKEEIKPFLIIDSFKLILDYL
ncbi:MAG: HAD-IIA family hydrolase [Promethearchaeota archaeon]